MSGEILPPSGMPFNLDKYKVWAAVLDSHKTMDKGFDRVLFFGPRSQAILTTLINGRTPRESIFRPVEGRIWGVGPGSAKATGKRAATDVYQYTALTHAIAKGCKRANIPPFSPYQIRHASFKNVQSKYGRDAARAYGGHKVGGATEDYAGVDLSTAARIASEWG